MKPEQLDWTANARLHWGPLDNKVIAVARLDDGRPPMILKLTSQNRDVHYVRITTVPANPWSVHTFNYEYLHADSRRPDPQTQAGPHGGGAEDPPAQEPSDLLDRDRG